MKWGGILVVVASAWLIPAGIGYAGMTRMFCPEDRQTVASRDTFRTDDQPLYPAASFSIAEMTGSLHAVVFPLEPDSEGSKVCETNRPEILADRQNSLGLCLYGLISAAMCHSVPWAFKRINTAQGSHHYEYTLVDRPCLAISKTLLRPEPMAYVVQPESAPEDSTAQSRQETVAALWRMSQFTPTAQSPRGPPSDDREALTA